MRTLLSFATRYIPRSRGAPAKGRRPARLLAGRDVLGPEVARVRDEVDPVDFEDFPRRPGGRL
jgi:hypothetical protein